MMMMMIEIIAMIVKKENLVSFLFILPSASIMVLLVIITPCQSGPE